VNLPNLITFGRLLAVPATVWLILADDWQPAFWVFVAAGVSDAVDGALARLTRSQSDLGRALDPAADKALLVSIYIALGVKGMLPAWLVILVVFRDAMLVGAMVLMAMMERRLNIDPSLLSKINTGLQIALAALVLSESAFDFGLDAWIGPGVWLVAASTLASGLGYLFTRRGEFSVKKVGA